MMTYKKFVNELARELKSTQKLPEDLSFTAQRKMNGVISNTLTIKSPDLNVAPCIHMDYFYDEYLAGRDIADIAADIIDIYCKHPGMDLGSLELDWERVKDYVIFTLINAEANEELLSDAPHLLISDLALIFRIDTAFINISGYITIRQNLFEMLDINLKTLVETAINNTKRLLPPAVLDMADLIEGIDPALRAETVTGMTVISNSEKRYGAAAILLDETDIILKSKGFTEDDYLLPSSVHEFILIPATEAEPEGLAETVRMVNRSSAIEREEYLADRVYTYGEIKKAFANALLSLANA